MSGCPAGARNWHISYFSMLLHSKKPVYLGFSGKQNCSDTCVPEQFFPRCQNGRAKPPHCLFSQQKTAPGSQIQGGLSRDSERFLRETAPGGHFLAAELFSTDGDLSACKEGFRDGGQPGAEALSRFRRIPPRNSIGIRAAARSHKERKVFALFICARQRIIGAAAHQILKLIAAGLSKGIPRLRDRHIPIAGYRQRHIAVEGTDPGVCRDAALRSGPSQSSSGI